MANNQVIIGVQKTIRFMLEEYEYAHYEEFSQSRVESFNSLCKQIELKIYELPRAKRVLTAIRNAKHSCYWKDALKHLAIAEREIRNG